MGRRGDRTTCAASSREITPRYPFAAPACGCNVSIGGRRSPRPRMGKAQMALKDLLVHIDASQANDARVRAAIALARHHEAHLGGLYVLPWKYLPAYAEFQLPPEIIETQQKTLRAQARRAEQAFRSATAEAGLQSEWSCVEGELLSTLLRYARYTDLMVVGQPAEEDPLSTSQGVADELAIHAGTPVLVIPYIGAREAIGERVLVAWNGRRESARALHDALPLLERARTATVVSVNPHTQAQEEGNLPATIGLHLARHGIHAEPKELIAPDLQTAEVLLSHAASIAADLIVMGAYGHSRVRELILGGVTRHVLRHMTVPVLLSH